MIAYFLCLALTGSCLPPDANGGTPHDDEAAVEAILEALGGNRTRQAPQKPPHGPFPQGVRADSNFHP